MYIPFAEYFSWERARPSQFLHSLQLRISLYWQALSSASAANALIIPPPNFQELLMSVSLQSWIPPSMPGQAAPMGNVLPGAPPQQPSSSLGTPGPSPSNPSTGTGDSSGTPARQYEVRNNNVLPDVAAAMQGRKFQLRTLFGHGRPSPQHAYGRPMCCTYHLLGRCSNTCNRAYSHCELTTAERKTLRTFLNKQIVTPDIERGQHQPQLLATLRPILGAMAQDRSLKVALAM